MKTILLAFISLLIFVPSIAQNKIYEKYSDIDVVTNIDSLDKIDITAFDNKKKIIYLLVYEKSKLFSFDYDFGKNLQLLDSLTALENNATYKTYSKYLKSKFLSDKATEKETCVTLTLQALNEFLTRKDTLGALGCYSTLISINIRNYEFQEQINVSNKEIITEYLKNIEQLATNYPNDENANLILYNAKMRFYYTVAHDMVAARTAAFTIIQKLKNINPKSQHLYPFYVYVGYDYLQQSNTDSTLTYFKKLYDLHNVKRSKIKISADCNVAYAFNFLKQYDSAIIYSQKGIDNIRVNKVDMLGELQSAFRTLYSAAYANNMIAYAWGARNTYDSIANVIKNTTKATQFEQLQTIYLTKQLEQDKIELLYRQKVYIIAVLIVVSLLLFIVYLFTKSQKQNKLLIDLEQFRNKVHAIISHDFRSPLFALQGLYSQAAFLIKHNEIDTLKTISENIDEVSNRMAGLLTNVLAWAETNNTKSKTEVRIKQQIDETSNLYKNIYTNKNVQLLNVISEDVVLVLNVNVLNLIIRNWLDNVLKYANATQIEIYSNQLASTIEIIIKDNGIILPKALQQMKQQFGNGKKVAIISETSTGLGLGLMSYFAMQEGWTLNLDAIDSNNKLIIKINID